MQTEKKSYFGLQALSLIYALVVNIWFFMQILSGDQYWWVYMINIVAIYLFIPFFGQLIAAIWSKKALIWASMLVVALIWAYYFGAFFIPKNDTIIPKKSVTLMTSNVLTGRKNPEAFISSLIRSNADVIAFQELNSELANAIRIELDELYPYQTLKSSVGFDGMGIISKYPLTVERNTYRASWPVGFPQIVTIDADGYIFRLINFHAQPPEIAPEAALLFNNIRNEEAQELLVLASQDNTPTILLGDLNATAQNDAYRIITTAFSDVWKEKGYGLGHTKTNPLETLPPQWLARIDYIFHSSDLYTLSAEIGPWDTYSDHRPVIAEIGFR